MSSWTLELEEDFPKFPHGFPPISHLQNFAESCKLEMPIKRHKKFYTKLFLVNKILQRSGLRIPKWLAFGCWSPQTTEKKLHHPLYSGRPLIAQLSDGDYTLGADLPSSARQSRRYFIWSLVGEEMCSSHPLGNRPWWYNDYSACVQVWDVWSGGVGFHDYVVPVVCSSELSIQLHTKVESSQGNPGLSYSVLTLASCSICHPRQLSARAIENLSFTSTSIISKTDFDDEVEGS